MRRGVYSENGIVKTMWSLIGFVLKALDSSPSPAIYARTLLSQEQQPSPSRNSHFHSTDSLYLFE